MIYIPSLVKHIYDVVGAIFEVHKELGPGLNEYVYQEGLMIELEEQKIEFEREKDFRPLYHGKLMNASYRVDFLCKGDIVVECKSVSELLPIHYAQLYNYMRLLKKPCGIVVNFASTSVHIGRYFLDPDTGVIYNANGKRVQWVTMIEKLFKLFLKMKQIALSEKIV